MAGHEKSLASPYSLSVALTDILNDNADDGARTRCTVKMFFSPLLSHVFF